MMNHYNIRIIAMLFMVLSMWLLPLSRPGTGRLLAAEPEPATAIESTAVRGDYHC